MKCSRFNFEKVFGSNLKSRILTKLSLCNPVNLLLFLLQPDKSLTNLIFVNSTSNITKQQPTKILRNAKTEGKKQPQDNPVKKAYANS